MAIITVGLYSNSTQKPLGHKDFNDTVSNVLATAAADPDFINLSGGTIGSTGDASVRVLQIHPDINTQLGKFMVAGGHFNDSAPTLATPGNIAPIRITEYRASHVNLRNNSGVELGVSSNPLITSKGKTIQRVSIDLATSGDNSVIAAPGTGLSIKIIAYKLQNTSGSDTTITLKDDNTSINGQGFLLTPGAKDEFYAPANGEGEIVLTANKPLKIALSADNQLSGFIIYRTDS